MGEQSLTVLDQANTIKLFNNAFREAERYTTIPGSRWLDTLISGFMSGGIDETAEAKHQARLNKKQAAISALGLDRDAGDDFRLMYYEDKGKRLFFRGQAKDDGGIRITDSMVLPDSGNEISGDFRPLLRPIDLPAPVYKSSRSGVEEGTITLSAEQSKTLNTEVALIAIAQNALRSNIPAEGSIPHLPSNLSKSRGR